MRLPWAVGLTVDSITLGSLTDGLDSTVNGVTYRTYA